MLGFLNLNKPAGLTSHDCVAKVRKALHLRQVGHGGTLDPMAIGVLPIAIGKATRLLQFLQPGKVYDATIRLGIVTATDDIEGEVLAQAPVSTLTLSQVQTTLLQFQGTIQQVPPRYSAIQVQGKRLYDLARAGEDVVVPSRSVTVKSITILDWRPGDFPELDLAITCGAGTYIRSIARDLGIALQTGGTLTALTRTDSSGFRLADSVALEELESGSPPIVPPDTVLTHIPWIRLSTHEADRWCYGQRLALPEVLAVADSTVEHRQGHCRVYDPSGFLGIGEWRETDTQPVLQPRVVLRT